MNGYLYLALAIAAEVIATTSMKAVDGLNKPLPLLLVIVGYSIAFWMLILVVRTIPVGIAYAIWAGLGIILVSIAAMFVYDQKPDLPAVLGMGLIVSGVVVIQLFPRHRPLSVILRTCFSERRPHVPNSEHRRPDRRRRRRRPVAERATARQGLRHAAGGA